MFLQFLERCARKRFSWADPVNLAEFAVAQLQAHRAVPDHEGHGQCFDDGPDAGGAVLPGGSRRHACLLRQQYAGEDRRAGWRGCHDRSGRAGCRPASHARCPSGARSSKRCGLEPSALGDEIVNRIVGVEVGAQIPEIGWSFALGEKARAPPAQVSSPSTRFQRSTAPPAAATHCDCVL